MVILWGNIYLQRNLAKLYNCPFRPVVFRSTGVYLVIIITVWANTSSYVCTMKQSISLYIFIALFFGAIFFVWQQGRNGFFHANEITSLTHPWDTIIPNQNTPPGIHGIHAEECGQCHQEIYQEWTQSTHAHAWTDEQYQAELAKNNDLFVCKNCHLPVQNQQKLITTGLYDGDYNRPVQQKNTRFDARLQHEGITCVACHMNNQTIIGVRDVQANHPVKVDTDYLSEKLCISCHDAHSQLSEELVCTFETGKEWKEGPYSAQGTNCLDCHMPIIDRPSTTGGVVRKGHRHYFPGSGIPKDGAHHPKMLTSLAYEVVRDSADLFHLGFSVTNQDAGHKVPTGDPERHLFVVFQLIQHQQVIQVDSFRIGESWQWYPRAKKLSDNNLLPKEKRVFEVHYAVQDTSNLFWRVVVTKHRMTPEIHEYHHLSDDYPIFVTIYDKTWRFLDIQ